MVLPWSKVSPPAATVLVYYSPSNSRDIPIGHLIPKWLLLGLFKIFSKKQLIKISKSGDTPHSPQEPSHSINSLSLTCMPESVNNVRRGKFFLFIK